MKKLLQLILLFCFYENLSSQTITATGCNPLAGDILKFASTSTTISPGPTGTGQLWNFLNLPQSSTYIDTFAMVSASNSMNFPDANVCSYTQYPYATFYKTSSSGVEMVGEIRGQGLMQFTNPRTIVPFPFSYGSSIIDTWNYTETSTAPTTTTNGTTTITADASGDLITPGGNFTGVLRLHHHMAGTVTGTAPNLPFSHTFDFYRWFINGIHEPVLTSTPYATDYLFSSLNGLGIADHSFSDINFKIYPNPASEKVIVSTIYEFPLHIKLMNNLGQVVGEYIGSSEKTFSLDVSSLSQGVYFVSVSDMNGSLLHKSKLLISR